jgi:hypothetical protein
MSVFNSVLNTPSEYKEVLDDNGISYMRAWGERLCLNKHNRLCPIYFHARMGEGVEGNFPPTKKGKTADKVGAHGANSGCPNFDRHFAVNVYTLW